MKKSSNDNRSEFPAIGTKRVKFKALLKTIFQYQHDRISLDFGVYRIFRHKAAEIERFLLLYILYSNFNLS